MAKRLADVLGIPIGPRQRQSEEPRGSGAARAPGGHRGHGGRERGGARMTCRFERRPGAILEGRFGRGAEPPSEANEDLQHDGAHEGGSRPADARRDQDVLVRGDGVRPLSRRSRADADGLRRDLPLPALRRLPGHVRAQLHGRRRQDHPARRTRRASPLARCPSAYIAAFHEDMAALGVVPPDVEPKATEHVPEMIALIERLIAGGYAYVVDGDVYFEVRPVPGLRQALGQEPRRAAGRRPRRGGRAQAGPA